MQSDEGLPSADEASTPSDLGSDEMETGDKPSGAAPVDGDPPGGGGGGSRALDGDPPGGGGGGSK